MKAQFLKMAGVNSEEEFYNMYPTEEAFFQVYPEARQMAHGGQPYPWSYPEYGMQGKGAGAQIPVETYYAYGGPSNGPLGYFDDGGSAWNYGQFPAIAKKGNQVQGGKIDNVVETNKNNFLSAIQKNTNNALMNEASDEAFQMTQFAQYGKQTGSQFNPNMYNQNMFESRLDDLNNQSAQANRNVLGLAKFFTNNAINRKMRSIADQQKAQDEYYKNLETESGFKDAQTVPGFDPIPGNMAKLGGSFEKYQKGGKTVSQLERENTLNKAYNEYKEAEAQYKLKYDYYNNSGAIGFSQSKRDNLLVDLKAAEANMLSKKAAFDKLNTSLVAKVPGELKGNFVEKEKATDIPPAFEPNYGTFNPGSSNAYTPQAPAPAAPAKTQAKTPAPKAATAPKAPAKPKYDTTGLAEYNKRFGQKKLGGIQKYDGGGGVNAAKSDTDYTTYNDGSVFNNKTGAWIKGADPSWKPEGVPPMTYKPGTEAKTETTPTTTPTTTGEMSAEEKAVRDFATAKGQNPDEVWKNYQAITSSYGTMGAGTQQPYGYGVSSMIPYRYKHRGYGSIGWDRGYVPGDLDLRAMEEQAMKMGYDFYGKSRPTLFGGRKVVIKTHYNPATGKVENKPVVESAGSDSSMPEKDISKYTQWTEPVEDTSLPFPEQPSWIPNQELPAYPYPNTNEPVIPKGPVGPKEGDQYQYGGLSRFLPKHQVLGETGFKFDNLDINVPIMDTFHNIKTGLTSINDFKQQRADARREKRGTDEKAVWKTGPSPYAADTVLTGMSALSNLARGKERKALEEKLATGKMSDKLFTSVGKNQGDYVPTGQEYGMFRPDQTTPIFDSGYDRGNAGRPTIGYDRGGSVAYSDWSQTPVNGYYGVPQGEFSPYSQWSQSPVKMQSGGAMMQDGVYDLTEDEINEIIQMGGQVEFLD